MLARLHHPKFAFELLKVQPFLRLQRVLDEKWNDAFPKVCLTSHPISHPIAVIPSNHAASEIGFECVKHLHIAFVLHDGEFRKNLIASRHINMFIDANIKAAFTIHETCNPLSVEFHRLVPNVKSLRVPGAVTGPSLRIVPMSVGFLLPSQLGDDEYRTAVEEFPAYGSVLLRLAIPNLRTVIVTAAVYRGFSSELRRS